MPHSHDSHRSGATRRWHRPTWQEIRRADPTARAVWFAVAIAALVTLIGLVALWPTDSVPTTPSGDEDPLSATADPISAHIVRTTTGPCTGTGTDDAIPCIFAELEIAGVEAPTVPRGGGAPTGGPVLERAIGSSAPGADLQAGDDIYVNATTRADGSVVYTFYDYQRDGTLWVLTIIFVLAVVLLGRWRGLGAIAGLAASLLVLVVFMLPAILDGRSPVMVAVVGASVIAFIALYLAHGFTTATSVALIGTFASLAITAILSSVFIASAKLTGFTDDSSYFLSALGGEVDMRGILLAGFVIGALGVLDDVTVTQVSAVAELRLAQPDATHRQLYRSAVNIGRDHISSTVNTLFLAYAGAALPLLLLFTQTRQAISSLAGREIIATEIIRSLVGSIGLVSAVPITTWLAVRTVDSHQ